MGSGGGCIDVEGIHEAAGAGVLNRLGGGGSVEVVVVDPAIGLMCGIRAGVGAPDASVDGSARTMLSGWSGAAEPLLTAHCCRFEHGVKRRSS